MLQDRRACKLATCLQGRRAANRGSEASTGSQTPLDLLFVPHHRNLVRYLQTTGKQTKFHHHAP